ITAPGILNISIFRQFMTNGQNNAVRSRHGKLMTRATYASVFTGLFLTIIKLVAYIFTGSVALLTSLIDSIIYVVSSLVNMFSVRQSLIPTDTEHRFFHGNVESMASLVQAYFMCRSVLFILFEAVNKLVNTVKVEHGVMGIIVMLISIIVTIVLVIYQHHVIRNTASVAISADSLHYASDLWFNTSVIIAIVLSYYLD